MADVLTSPAPIAEVIEGLPNICGWENEVAATVQQDRPAFLERTNLRLDRVHSAFSVALHMHQPAIPAGAHGEMISNLQYMFEHPDIGDNHNAGPFAWCYGRMGDMIPELVSHGCNPRVMLDYSGTLLWGLRQMDRGDILDNLKRLTCDPSYQPYVEWLGTLWGHAVVPSTPVPDVRLHIRAWQQHFASIFGWDALARVRGFSPPEMHLPNHPDECFAYVKALQEARYRWLLVQEHSVETLDGRGLGFKHVPHLLTARNSQGESTSIIALIKTQGSDTKLIGQMQPYYEAKTLSRQNLGGVSVPPLVTQIADGENGGVMMNEFPDAYRRAWYEMRDHGGGTSGVVGMNGTEYLELLEAAGVQAKDLPGCQPLGQHRIWQRVGRRVTPEAVENAIEEARRTDPNFHMDGGSWTNDRSWVRGYESVLTPMAQLSALFHQTVDHASQSREHRYRNALLHNLLLQTSCFRYWGEGMWTDYAREIYRRGSDILRYDFPAQ